MFRVSGIALTWALFASMAAVADEGDAAVVSPEQAAFFETSIRPVLVEHCLECHSGDEPESGLNLESRAGLLRGGKLGVAVVPGKPTESLLVSAIKHDEFIKMPPKEKLPTRQILDLTQWVQIGAPWPNSQPVADAPAKQSELVQQFTEEQKTHWAFQSVTEPVPPAVNSDWPQSPIDQFILAKLDVRDLQPAVPADKRTLIRRATYDLTGLPPTPAEVDAFLADDAPDALAKVVDRLLASPRYGEHWGRHWLDVVRYADSNGLDENLSYAHAFRYRDYVISSFNDDKPFARFVQEQIAGDLLPEADNEKQNLDRLIATGFLAIGAKMLAEDDPMKMQMDIIDEQISTLCQAFMGLTIGCARCHDHKFDPLPTQDYYSLAGIFKSSKTMENHNVVAVWYERPLVSAAVTEQIEEIDQQIAQTTQQVEQLKSEQRQQIALQMRGEFGHYLMATEALRRFQGQSESRREALTAGESPLPVRSGFALFEAEAFHRGNAERLSVGYGEGIGIIGTHGAGFVEYDLDVERAGTYQLEIRHAAADSRPLKLFVNGTTTDTTIAGQVTGSWYPDGQRWFSAGTVELNAGQNLLKLDSDKVYPHVDRLALIYHGPEPWPFASLPPRSLAQIAAQYHVKLELVSVWNDFLTQVSEGKLQQFPSFETWLAFTQLNEATFSQSAAELKLQLSSTEGIGATTPALLKKQLLAANLKSLQDVATVFHELLNTIPAMPSGDEELSKEWLQSPSPLLGPPEIVASLLSPDARQQLLRLEDTLKQLESSRPAYDVAMGITEATPEDLRIHLRGSHIALGKNAPRRFPRIITDVPQLQIGDNESGRLQLAQWLTSPEHPLTHRVIVNRIWHWHFGRGLTPTVDNFGLLGKSPTHPKLLDWLTRRFLENGGSLKQMHRLIMLSSAWQMSTRFSEAGNAADPDNESLWRFRRRRLSAEEMRDSLIALGKGLDDTMGGSLLKVKNRGYVTVSGTNVTDEYDNLRRSVYLPVVRSAVYEVLQTFDFPDPAVASGQRQTSTVAPQALMMMNSELVEEQTLAMAQRLLKQPGDQQRIATVFQEVLNRQPSVQEFEQATQFLQQIQQTSSLAEADPQEAAVRAWQSYCRVLLSSNEFAYVE